jgi:hypothetical protein
MFFAGCSLGNSRPRQKALVPRELLVQQDDPRSPERGQSAFIQALIREVAYNTLAKRDRKIRHPEPVAPADASEHSRVTV